VNPADTWDLTPLYTDGAAWERDFSELQVLYPGLAIFEGKLGGSAVVLRDAMEASKRVNLLIERLAQYASLKTSEDSSNSESLTREGQLENLMTRIGEITAYMDPEIQAIDDQTFESFLGTAELRDWQIPLRKLRRLKPHNCRLPRSGCSR
jgi:oligoendopeptidase F